MSSKGNRLIEVGFKFRGFPYTFRAFEPSPFAYYCEPGSEFKKVGRAELAVIECSIEQAEQPGERGLLGKVEAHWDRLELRLIDAAPDQLFYYQPSRGSEEEEAFNSLLITCEEAIKEAIRQARAAHQLKPITAHRKHLS